MNEIQRYAAAGLVALAAVATALWLNSFVTLIVAGLSLAVIAILGYGLWRSGMQQGPLVIIALGVCAAALPYSGVVVTPIALLAGVFWIVRRQPAQ